MLYFALLRFVSKRKGHTETLINRSSLIAPRTEHEVVLLVLSLQCELYSPQVSDYSVSCDKALGKDIVAYCRQSVCTLPLFVHFKIKFDKHFVQRVVWSRLTFNFPIIKLESSEAFLLKLEKNLSQSLKFFFLHFFVLVKMRF